ncbi:uracil-DNA glycosylase [Clostridium rectalis]|uniref:uracil-DNA glycosylase n=1 Tax=Clostridium rectalis TaxID=2040295 RepID=UPI000F63C2F4|nr:uracil-DNA glycosylase [Clostridium rectalis]
MTLEDLKFDIREICNNYKKDFIGGWITGDGPIPCHILFIGEAPGKTEVEQGKPFVGVAGKNFEYYLNMIDVKRSSIRITNTCYFRPIKVKETKNGKKSISNRTPKVSEINLFNDILDKEISLADPKLIVTLGNIPLKRLTNFKSIGQCHGEIIFNNYINKYIFPMYHPSALTYNRNDTFKNMYLQDWLKLKETLDKI